MRLKKFLNESDVGQYGKQFEEHFINALNLLGMEFKLNTNSGALWDIKTDGSGWDRFFFNELLNIKISRTKTMFATSDLYHMLPWESKEQSILDEKIDTDKLEKEVRKWFIKNGASKILFLKPKNEEVEKEIISASKKRDLGTLYKLFQGMNFRAEKLGWTFKVRVLTKNDGYNVSSVVIDKGNKVFMRSEKPRNYGGVKVAFRTPTKDFGTTDRVLIKGV